MSPNRSERLNNAPCDIAAHLPTPRGSELLEPGVTVGGGGYGEPRISGADGHLLHGTWHVGTARNAAKTRHLAARPVASVAHMRGEDLGVFAHGFVVTTNIDLGVAVDHPSQRLAGTGSVSGSGLWFGARPAARNPP